MPENVDQVFVGSSVYAQAKQAQEIFLPSTRPDKLQELWAKDLLELRAVNYFVEKVNEAGNDWHNKIPNYNQVHEELTNTHVTELKVVKRLYHLLGADENWKTFIGDKSAQHTQRHAIQELEKVTGFTIDLHPTQLRVIRDLAEITALCDQVRSYAPPKEIGSKPKKLLDVHALWDRVKPSISTKIDQKTREALLSEALLESRFRDDALLPPSMLVDVDTTPELFNDRYIDALLLDSVNTTVLEDERVRTRPILSVYNQADTRKIDLLSTKLKRAARRTVSMV